MTNSNEKPKTIERLGLSTFAFNYDIKEEILKDDNENERIEYQYKTLIFEHLPTQGEIINRIISDKYPDGEESAIHRKGILDRQNPEFVAYNEFVENTKAKIKKEFEENEAI